MCEHALNAGCISFRNAMGVTISIFSKHLFKGMTWTSFIVSGLCVILMDLHSFGEKKNTHTCCNFITSVFALQGQEEGDVSGGYIDSLSLWMRRESSIGTLHSHSIVKC